MEQETLYFKFKPDNFPESMSMEKLPYSPRVDIPGWKFGFNRESWDANDKAHCKAGTEAVRSFYTMLTPARDVVLT